jgi:hypothetical protein
MEYINEYRDGDIFYHVSLKENIQSLLQSGFDQNQIGTQGGCQGGSGFSCTWSERDARDWGQKIYGWGSELHLAVVKVSLPGVKLATHQQADEASQAARQWGLEQGYLLLSDEGLAPSEKLQKTCNQDDLLADWGWAIIGLYLQSQGYDGYFVGMDEVIIMNFSILGASAFELVVR